ncbi:MAG: D-aminoacylase [Candidatus Bathyarchaeota archaeon]|jgi:N-acyl-D-amino-acid deacylase
MEHYDVMIKGGKIVDGSGNPWFKGDVAVRGDKIAKIGDLASHEAEMEIDATGLLICPGFIDVHTHTDDSFIINPKADSKIRQGVTTEILGNCGNSLAPITELGKSFEDKRFKELGIEWDWNTVAEYLDRLEKVGMPVNVGTLVGHGTVRASIMGYEARAPSEKELEGMKELVDQGMKDGAFGLSTGIKYAPGVYADTQEIIELSKVVSKYGGVYATHIRNQGDHLIESVEEAITIGREAGCPVQIAHLKVKGRMNWGKSFNMLRIIDEARDEGVDITFDQYPYIAASTGASAITPKWAREGGTDSFLERLKDPEQRQRIEKGVIEQEDWTGSLKLLVCKFDPDPTYEGKSIAEIAELRGKTRQATMCDLILEAEGRVPLILFFGWDLDVKAIMTHHAMMVGSDGSSLASYGELGKGKPHPRNYGAFPRFLGKYVIREKFLSLEDGIRRMTSFPASRYGLLGRGLLKTGGYADVTLVDPDRVIDKATFQDPHQYAEGVEYVLVNGALTVEREEYNGAQAGKALRHSVS